MNPPVVVGITGSDRDAPAMSWAAQEALSRDVPLRIVCAYPIASGDALVGATAAEMSSLRQAGRVAQQLVETAITRAAQRDPSIEVVGEAVDGYPSLALLEESRSASCIVLGARRMSAIRSSVAGSVSAAVAAGAHCPAIVVHGEAAGSSNEGRVVVVGIDGVDAAADLLEFSFDTASRRHAGIRAILACEPGHFVGTAAREDARQNARLWLAEALAGWQEKYPDVHVQSFISPQGAVDALVAESASAFLLAVGSHGGAGKTGTFLGSVSRAVLRHARCPVAVVPSGELTAQDRA